MEAFLIAVTVIFAILMIIINIYLLALYCHPDDKGYGAAGFSQVIGLTLSWAQVLMLPLDVGNARGDRDMDMKNFWIAIFMIISIMIAILIPMAIYYYESDEDDSFGRRLFNTFFHEVCTLIIALAILFITWAFWRWAHIPVEQVVKSAEFMELSSKPISADNINMRNQNNSDQSLEIEVSFPIYLLGIMSFIGWFFFVIFGGCGLIALPLDLIIAFKHRPQMTDVKDAASMKVALKEETDKLIKMGSELKDRSAEVANANGFFDKHKKKHNLQKDFSDFKASVSEIENLYQKFKQELDLPKVNPLVFFGKLILGIIFLGISISWLLHILIFMLIKVNGYPSHPFLNKMLTDLEEKGVGFLSTGLFILFTIYLLWSVTKGIFKFGVRVPFFFKFHPMKVHETWMNTFLFNTIMILLCSVAVTQFCSNAFSAYTRFTDIDILFGVQIKYLRFYKYFYDKNVFEIAFLVWSILAGLYFVCRPYDKPQFMKLLEKKKAKV